MQRHYAFATPTLGRPRENAATASFPRMASPTPRCSGDAKEWVATWPVSTTRNRTRSCSSWLGNLGPSSASPTELQNVNLRGRMDRILSTPTGTRASRMTIKKRAGKTVSRSIGKAESGMMSSASRTPFLKDMSAARMYPVLYQVGSYL